MISIKEVYQFLADNGYIVSNFVDVGIVLSKKFNDDLEAANKKPILTVKTNLPSVVQKKEVITDWRLKFAKFLIECKVPSRLQAPNGTWYDGNKYSEEAMKVFKKAIEGGIDQQILMRAVQLYYASSASFKKKVSNYFVDGDWYSDYLKLVDAAQQGGTEGVKQLIQKEIKPDGHSPYSL